MVAEGGQVIPAHLLLSSSADSTDVVYWTMKQLHSASLSACLAALLAMAACTVSYEMQDASSPPSASSVPTGSNVEQASHMRTLVEEAVNMGLGGSSWKDWAGVPYGFTVVDSSGNPVPRADVVADLDSLGRLRIGSANAQGQIRLAFSEALLRRNPAVFGLKGGQFYGVEFNFTASTEVSEPLQVVDLQSLARQEVEPDVLWYSPSVTTQKRALFADVLRRQRAFIKGYLGLEPIPFGMALVDTSGNVSVSPSEVQVGDRMVQVFPYALRDEETPMGIATTNLHEWVEASLRGPAFAEVPRWMGDGLAEHARLAQYRALSPEERRRLKVEAWLRDALPRLRGGLEEAMERQDTFNLADWPYLGPDYPLTASTQAIGYGVAMSFWNNVTEAEGKATIKRFLEALPRNKDISSEEAVETLEEVTGTDYTDRLRSYPFAEVEQFLGEVEKEILGGER